MENAPTGLALRPEDFKSAPPARTTSIRDLRLSQDYLDMDEVMEVTTSVEIGKPNHQVFFRAHTEWKGLYPVFEQKHLRKSEFFIVDAQAVPELAGEVTPRLLVPLITRDRSLYIWPLRVGTADREMDLAAQSAHVAIEQAKLHWVKIKWNGNKFDCRAAKSDLDPPQWPPDLTWDQMVELAFGNRVIDSPNHPAVKALNGEL